MIKLSSGGDVNPFGVYQFRFFTIHTLSDCPIVQRSVVAENVVVVKLVHLDTREKLFAEKLEFRPTLFTIGYFDFSCPPFRNEIWPCLAVNI
jgi:hypothetical protein